MRPLAGQTRDIGDTRRLWAESQETARSGWNDPVRVRFDEHHARALTSELAGLSADIEQADDAFAAILSRLSAS
jgi:hypothetical protein